jgi:enoyl-CoA hydratase/carnithine racemase
MSTSSEGRITTEIDGHVLRIGIDRTAKMNSFTLSMLTGLAQAFTEYEQNPELRCGVVCAVGEHFTAGLDLANVAPAFSRQGLVPPGLVDPFGTQGPARQKPMVVAVQGRCLTLGIELVLACDLCVAADNSRFGQIEIKRGIFPFGGATFRMPQAFGWGNAMRYLLTGDEFGAAEALRLGLVQEVVPLGQQLERAMTLARTIAAQAPLGVQATLASARLSVEQGPEAAAAALLPALQKLLSSDDAREGMQSFIERRSARFSGK